MKRATKAVMTAAALPLAAALPFAFGGAAMPGAAAAALIPEGPATVLTHGPTPWAMNDALGGAVCKAPKVCRQVSYDWIQPYGPIEFGVRQNVNRLDRAIHRVDNDSKIVYAFSGGARVASVWLKDHADDADAPAPEDLSFVLIGNGGRKYGGVNGWFWGDLLLTPTDTQYDIVDVAREYDPIADFPSNPFNLLALANGIVAFQYVHMRYDEVDLDDPDNIVWTEGRTTYVFVPTEHLPLLQPFYDAGLGDLVKDHEPRLREIIDSAYNRTWLEDKEPQGATETSATSQRESPVTPARSVLAKTADRQETGKPATATGDDAQPDAEATEERDSVAQPDPESEQTAFDGTDATVGTDETGAAGADRHPAPLNGAKKTDGAQKTDATDTTTGSESTTPAATKAGGASAGSGTDSGGGAEG